MRPIKHVDPDALVRRIRENVPQELRDRPQWVIWKISQDRKVPLSPSKGGYASCSDPSTWATFETAARVFLHNSHVCRGFNFATGFGLAGLDLDGVLDSHGDLLDATAGMTYRTMLSHLDSYAETTPSGTGLRVFFLYKGAPLPNRKKGEIELYFDRHFLSVTGDLFEGRSRLRESTLGAARIEQHLRPLMPLLPRRPPEDVPADDGELLRRMFDSKRGSTIQRLWAGEVMHKSPSESDYALMGDLAYWTGGDVERMIRMFLDSGRAERLKGRRPDYLRNMALKVSM